MIALFLVTVELPGVDMPQTETTETIEQMYKAIHDVLAIAFPSNPYKVNTLESADDAAAVFRYRQQKGAQF